jgi:hypothetical protein
MKSRICILLNAVAFTAVITIFMTACKKEGLPSPIGQQNSESGSFARQYPGMKHLKQANYYLTEPECAGVIRKFKKQETPNGSSLAKLITADSVALDSAVWVLEAALNYDFDYEVQEDYSHSFVSLEVNIGINDVKMSVSSDDLETAYEDLTVYINAHLAADADKKVELVDIESYLLDSQPNTVVLKMTVAFINSLLFQCSSAPFGTNTSTRWCAYYKNNWFGSWGCSYPGVANSDATSRLTDHLNCRSPYDATCAGYSGFYYINVNSNSYHAHVANSTFSGALFLGSYYANSWYCNSSNAWSFEIGASAANTYYTNCLTLAASNAFPGLKHINTSVTSDRWWSSPLVAWRLAWELNSYWGKKICRDSDS